MNEREVLFFSRMRENANKCKEVLVEAFDEIEKFIEFEECRFEALVSRQYFSSTPPETYEDDYVLRFMNPDNEVSAIYSFKDDTYSPESINFKGGDNEKNVMSNSQSEEDENLRYMTKRKDGRWQGSKVINGKRIFVYGKTKLETRQKLSEMMNKKPRETKRESFHNFALWWLDNCKKNNIADSTMRTYKGILNSHLKINTPINKITLQQLQELLFKLPPTRIREEVYKMIKPIIRKAYELDFIKKDFGQFLELGKIQRVVKRALTVEEQEKIIKSLTGDMFSRRVIFYLCTGARPAEIATVRKEELRPGWVKINGTKNNSSVRWIKISDKLYNMIQGESPEFFKFNNKRFRERLQDFCSKIGIEYHLDVYTLRHTFATNLYILRVPEKDRQSYMGHVQGSEITNNVYTTFSPDIKPINIYSIYGDWLPEF